MMFIQCFESVIRSISFYPQHPVSTSLYHPPNNRPPSSPAYHPQRLSQTSFTPSPQRPLSPGKPAAPSAPKDVLSTPQPPPRTPTTASAFHSSSGRGTATSHPLQVSTPSPPPAHPKPKIRLKSSILASSNFNFNLGIYQNNFLATQTSDRLLIIILSTQTKTNILYS